METFLCDTESFSLERRRSFHSFYYWLYAYLNNLPFSCTCSFSCFLFGCYLCILSTAHLQYACIHIKLISLLLSPLRHSATPRETESRRCDFFFPFALMHVSLMLQPLRKQRKLSLCPSNASSLCAVAFFRRFFATLTPHCCSAKIGLIAVYTQQRALSASLDKASMWKCEE